MKNNVKKTHKGWMYTRGCDLWIVLKKTAKNLINYLILCYSKGFYIEVNVVQYQIWPQDSSTTPEKRCSKPLEVLRRYCRKGGMIFFLFGLKMLWNYIYIFIFYIIFNQYEQNTRSVDNTHIIFHIHATNKDIWIEDKKRKKKQVKWMTKYHNTTLYIVLWWLILCYASSITTNTHTHGLWLQPVCV